MSLLPLLISVPHAGTDIPPEVEGLNLLTQAEIEADGDVGAKEIYDFADQVESTVSTPMARAFIDMNRAPTDIRKDGIVKTHTCWDVPIYSEPLPPDLSQSLIKNYHEPYHRHLTEKGKRPLILGVDCHTMADVGPPVGPDQGRKRPLVCLSHANGTCPEDWIKSLQREFIKEFGNDVRINDPFKGGFIIQHHYNEIPWIQLELSRTDQLSNGTKKTKVLHALHAWCQNRKKSKIGPRRN